MTHPTTLRICLGLGLSLLEACGGAPKPSAGAPAGQAGAASAAATGPAVIMDRDSPPEGQAGSTQLPAQPSGPARDELPEQLVGEVDGGPMRLIPGGRVRLGGGDERFPSVPFVEVELPPFWLDEHEVTNEQFAAFVAATGHVTEAERFGDSVVFEQGAAVSGWRMVSGASWRQPGGPGSSAELLLDHPVVHIALSDALAYAAWAQKRLPSEVEWECAARGASLAWPFVWGQSYDPEAIPANLWQGEFPLENRLLDGFAASAPVGSFAPNTFGLFDLAGNVWEWVQSPRGSGPLGHLHEPRSPGMEPGLDQQIRGGSFLCAPNYCQGYRPTARQFKVATDASNNVGFRCARSFGELGSKKPG